MDSPSLLNPNAHSNPLGQDLILKLILEHVGATDIDDLLNCRLVSHSWNRVAVQVLEHQHGYVLELNYEKLLKFKSLLWTSRMSRMNSGGQELESLRLSLSLHPKTHQKRSDNREIAASAKLLTFHPHLRVAFISIDYELKGKQIKPAQPNQGPSGNSMTNLELFTLFKLASPHLTKLTILDQDGQIPPHFEQFDFNSYLNLEFPRLTFVKYTSESFTTEFELLDLTNHVVHRIKQAPKLIKLLLTVYNGVNSTRILESCSEKLEELEFLIWVMETDRVKLLTEIEFPKLRVFTANGVHSASTLNEFVQLNSRALTDIRIELGEDVDLDEDFLNFPVLQNIRNFELRSSYDTFSGFTKLVHSIFSRIFPKLTSLKSLNFDLGILFILGTHLKSSGHLIPPPDQYPVLPAISTLEIQIPVLREKMFDVLDMATRIYHHTFPNLETLIIKPITEGTYLIELNEKELDLAFAFLCLHPGIQNLEIHNYSEDWLDQPAILNHSFPGLKSFLQMGDEVASTTEIQEFRNLIKRFANPFEKRRKARR